MINEAILLLPADRVAVGRRRKSALYRAELFFLTEKHNGTERGFARWRFAGWSSKREGTAAAATPPGAG